MFKEMSLSFIQEKKKLPKIGRIKSITSQLSGFLEELDSFPQGQPKSDPDFVFSFLNFPCSTIHPHTLIPVLSSEISLTLSIIIRYILVTKLSKEK